MSHKALFLDRDGVINVDVEYLHKKEDVVFTDGIFELAAYFYRMGYLIIVITNQSGIARGYYTEEDLLKLNGWMVSEFEKNGAPVTQIYYCPHHPEKGTGRYKVECSCRKPEPGMILKAGEEYDIDLPASILIGDKEDDISAGKRAGVGKNILMKSRYHSGETAGAADYIAESLRDILRALREKHPPFQGKI